MGVSQEKLAIPQGAAGDIVSFGIFRELTKALTTLSSDHAANDGLKISSAAITIAQQPTGESLTDLDRGKGGHCLLVRHLNQGWQNGHDEKTFLQASENVCDTAVISGLTVATSIALEVNPSSAGDEPSHADFAARRENFRSAASISNTVNSGFV